MGEKPERPLTSGQVAALFNVDQKTVARWVKVGLLPCFRTPGGHLRFRPAEVNAVLQAGRRDPAIFPEAGPETNKET